MELVEKVLCHLDSVYILTSVGAPPGVGICIKFSPMSLVSSGFLQGTQACSYPLAKDKLSLPERGFGNEEEAGVREERSQDKVLIKGPSIIFTTVYI